ncbi:MAG: fibronectin-binding protein [Mycobacterium sp.]
MFVRIAALVGGLVLAGGMLAAPASAEPMPGCELELMLICGMLPAMPDLDHDIDLTSQLPPADALPEPPMANICEMGCI